MTRNHGVLLLVSLLAALLFVLSDQAQAQDPPGGPGGRFNMMRGPGGGTMIMLALLRNEKIQKELELMNEQVTKLKAVADEQWTVMRDSVAALPRDLSQEERDAKMQELMKENQEKIMKKLGEILLPKQLDRLKEIQLQAEGPLVFFNPNIIKALDITSEQQNKMKAISDEAQAKRRELNVGMRDLSQEERRAKRAEMETKRKEIANEVYTKLLAILAPDQAAQLDKMKGEKLDIDYSTILRPGPNRRDGPGGPPPGGNPPSSGGATPPENKDGN